MPATSTLETFDEEDVTVDATAGGVRLTLARFLVSPPAKAATLTIAGAQIRWTKSSDRNLTATASGHVANPQSVIYLDSLQDIWSWRGIRTGATSGTVHAEYHR